MANEIYSTNMNLPVPAVGVTAGPVYATDINNCLSIIDAHDHSTGSGVKISPAGLNINSDLSFGSQNATNLRSLRLEAQGSPIPALTPDLAAIYVSGVDLYYNDAAGNQIRLTAAGSVAGSTGNITGLVSPASVTYTGGGSPVFQFLSDATISADLDAANLIMRNPGVTATYGLTLQAPTLSSNYSITLPTLPASTSFLTINSSGIVSTIPTALGISTAMIANLAVTTAKLDNLAVTDAKIANSTITSGKLAFAPTLTSSSFGSNGTFVVPAGITTVLLEGCGGGGGGGGGGHGNGGAGNNTGGASGGGGAPYVVQVMRVSPGETLAITIGAGGAGAAPSTVDGNSGSTGGTTSVVGVVESVFFRGGYGGLGGKSSPNGGAPAAQGPGRLGNALGGGGGSAGTSGQSGEDSFRDVGGGPGSSSGANSGGGGGGGGASRRAGGVGGNGDSGGGQTGAAALANSGAGGGGGSGVGTSAADGPAGGFGGSGFLSITYVPLA